MTSKTRFQSRKVSRSRTRVEALSPTNTYSFNRGINPFRALLNSIAGGAPMSEEERQNAHQLKMLTEKKRSKSQRRKSTQNRGN